MGIGRTILALLVASSAPGSGAKPLIYNQVCAACVARSRDADFTIAVLARPVDCRRKPPAHRPSADGACAIRRQFLSVIAPADYSAGMTDGGSGHAVASDQCPTWAASEANLRDRAVRLRNRRRRYCLRRSCDGYDKASNSNQPDHSYPPFFTVGFFNLAVRGSKQRGMPRISFLQLRRKEATNSATTMLNTG